MDMMLCTEFRLHYSRIYIYIYIYQNNIAASFLSFFLSPLYNETKYEHYFSTSVLILFSATLEHSHFIGSSGFIRTCFGGTELNDPQWIIGLCMLV